MAFSVYILFVAVADRIRQPARRTDRSQGEKTSLYGSGEAPPTLSAAPGYAPFFLVAIFFAMLHLGVLMLGTGTLPGLVIYVGGLMLALLALILG